MNVREFNKTLEINFDSGSILRIDLSGEKHIYITEEGFMCHLVANEDPSFTLTTNDLSVFLGFDYDSEETFVRIHSKPGEDGKLDLPRPLSWMVIVDIFGMPSMVFMSK